MITEYDILCTSTFILGLLYFGELAIDILLFLRCDKLWSVPIGLLLYENIA